jgi:hypothetical protein
VTCPRCVARYEQRFSSPAAKVTINVEDAERIVTDRTPVVIHANAVRQMLVRCTSICEQHLNHVNDDPVLVGQSPSGWMFIIDGMHRAARSVRDNTPLLAKVLTPAEVESIWLSA